MSGSGVDTESVHSGNTSKWLGITAVGTTVYAAPNYAPKLLVYDTTPVQGGMIAVVNDTGFTLDVDVSGAACRAEKEALKDDDASEGCYVDATRALAEACVRWFRGNDRPPPGAGEKRQRQNA